MKAFPPATSSQQKLVDHFDPKWEFRPVKRSDLGRIASWISTLSPKGASSIDEIESFLHMEWEVSRTSDFVGHHLATLFGQPMLHATVFRTHTHPEGNGQLIELHFLINPVFAENEDIWRSCLSQVFGHFSPDVDTTRLRVSTAASDLVQQSALAYLGFTPMEGQGEFNLTLQTSLSHLRSQLLIKMNTNN